MTHHDIEYVPVDDEISAAIGTVMNNAVHHLDAFEMGAEVIPQEFVMVSRKIV